MAAEPVTVVTEEIVAHVNSAKTTWTASVEQGHISRLTQEQAKRLLGARKVSRTSQLASAFTI